MGISPFVVGQTLPVLQVTLYKEGITPYSVGSPVDLTGLSYYNLSLNMYNTSQRTDQVGQGIFLITDAVGGVVQYVWDAQDTATPGQFDLYITASFLSGDLIFDPLPFVVNPK